MTDMRADLTLTLPATPENVSVLRAAVVGEAAQRGASAQLQQDVALAVSEAATNVILHAYRGAPCGDVRLRVSTQDDRLCVEVADDGSGMAPCPNSPGLGLGLPVIAQLADDLQVRTERGTTVLMRFCSDHDVR